MIITSLTDVEERSLALESRAFSRPGRRHLLWAMPDSGPSERFRWLPAGGPRWRLIALRVGGRLMLELRGVGYRYAGYARPVLHDIDLRLDDGEIVGLVGANEAGKSTLCLVASRSRAGLDRRRP